MKKTIILILKLCTPCMYKRETRKNHPQEKMRMVLKRKIIMISYIRVHDKSPEDNPCRTRL